MPLHLCMLYFVRIWTEWTQDENNLTNTRHTHLKKSNSVNWLHGGLLFCPEMQNNMILHMQFKHLLFS